MVRGLHLTLYPWSYPYTLILPKPCHRPNPNPNLLLGGPGRYRLARPGPGQATRARDPLVRGNIHLTE